MRAGEYERRPIRFASRAGSAHFDDGRDGAPDDEIPLPLEAEVLALKQLGFSKPLIARMGRRALANGTTIERELLSNGGVDESAYYEAVARLLDLPFLDHISPERLMDRAALDCQLRRPTIVRLHDAQQPPVTAIAPEAHQLASLAERLARHPGLKQALAIASPATIRKAVWEAGAERRVQATANALFEETPRLSARIVMTGRQGFYAGALSSAGISALLFAAGPVMLCLHIMLSLLYFSSFILRLTALFHKRPRPGPPLVVQGDEILPVYTVMVALYREAAVVRQLIVSLERIDWPRSRLDIKLVCEADDSETISAIKALCLGPQFEIIAVPPIGPRTKPKALSYALAGARGDYVAIYDAEDRPHPGQLKEAYASFRAAPEDIACLQAPLIISNMQDSWISALFSLEYSALFRGLLPVLARYRMPLPLGGTSNHFRTDVLKAAGGWDPYNVTEDADLGMRLYRLGYRSQTIRRQTLEDAPVTARVWVGQRTRWFKGWLQTWLVMMRDPVLARQEMGLAAFVVFHLLIGGMLISSLAHPAILLFLGITAVAMMRSPAEDIALLDGILFGIDAINIFGSYATFLALGASVMIEHEKRLVGWRWIATPLYWMMVSYAAWRAALELKTKPFFWNKTPHQPRQPADGAEICDALSPNGAVASEGGT
ncbi:MAG TPA: glycosyl transferase [Rhizobium sp.]|nr:glycosyl transferase [Rhizobium sp.]